ncbi:MAG: HEAT repeat domain-containing protein [Planctomycetes bacterium]|nr:HEAT repeat domain-containing protein [Planctomycetota bacterium]MBL7044345.1 HEAT repeat domain-containing protein [Pirellulaceae bacterium]
MRHHTRHVSVSRRDGCGAVHGESRIADLIQPARLTGMARFGVYLIFGLAMCALPPPTARGENPALDEAFQKLTTLEPGQGLEMLQPIREAVVQTRSDERARADLEARLIAILRGDATGLAKDCACRQLVIVGSDTCLPVLAGLLPNARLSYMARYALEGIGSPAAITTLREMLRKTDGRQQVGVVISLGRMADGDAVPELARLLDKEDAELRDVAVIALGRIGTIAAADALRSFADRAPEGLRDAVVDAELHAAELLCQQEEYQTAAELCESLLADDSERVRAAAFRGLIAAKPSEPLTMILTGLAAEEPWKRAVAADCVVGLKKPEEVKTIATGMPKLPTSGKIAALVSLKNHCDPAVREAALISLDQDDAEVRTAALTALIASGTAEDVARFADLASTAEDLQVRDAASETLRLMTADGTNEAMIALISEAKPPNLVVVRCALARRSPEFVPAFLRAAESSDAATRLEAFKALEIMATEKEAESLASLLAKRAEGEEREAAGRAVWMSCQKISDPALRSAPLLAAMKKTDAAGQTAILPSLARLGGERSLAAVRSAMQSKDPAVRDAGYRALANWPDAAVADELLDIAKSSEVESYRVWSLRAYARVVSLPNERPAQQTFEMLNSAMELATRTEDKELIVSRLASVRVPDALALLVSLLDKEELKNSAVPAVFTLAKGLSQSHPDQAKAALEKIQPLAKDAAILQQIPKVLRDIEARKRRQK